MHRILALLLCVALLLGAVPAGADGFTLETTAETDAQRLLRGYSANSRARYVYLTFGSYPFESDGTRAPCLWRVLAIENGYAFLLEEYVLDFMQFHTEKVDQDDWNDYLLYTTMNTTMKDDMFTKEELTAVRYTEELGWLFILDNTEFMTPDYGFRRIKTEVQWERECAPTPYAMAQPHSYKESNGKTWYWSRTCRHTAAGGYEWIIGYNGHISMAGFLRWGGVRPACYVDLTKLDHARGSGTEKDPYVFEVIP